MFPDAASPAITSAGLQSKTRVIVNGSPTRNGYLNGNDGDVKNPVYQSKGRPGN
ncbi:hypothetical protein SCOR_06450 [Sulfidibacter corallicola]